jgi:transcriptional regulator with XRE-family HTH domain
MATNARTAETFARLRTSLGWSRHEIARRVNCDPKTAHNWETAARECPPEILEWLTESARALRAIKPPNYQTLRPPSGRPAKGHEP